MRVVLDANIFASALMSPQGAPARVVTLVLQQRLYDLVMTSDILEEIRRVLFYPKIRKKITGSDEELNFWVDALMIISHCCEPRYHHEIIVHEDPDDDKYIIAALESHASYLISGDQHLLKLNKQQNVKIVSPQEFLTHLT